MPKATSEHPYLFDFPCRILYQASDEKSPYLFAESIESNPDKQVQVVAVRDEGDIQVLIKTIRGVQVIIDRDVARLYGVATGALNRQLKRNEERFPEDFMFRLSSEEWDNLKCQIGISS